ncbi:MAG: RNA-guided pseudouridylation complex pseudouridine synthase subunit Cbf5 [archaeon]
MKKNVFPWMHEKKVLVKREAAHNSELGQDPCNRPIAELLDYSIVNIDKPSGPSSHQVSAYVKNILCIDKSGHSGTLDPKVTGALPVGLGRGTRIVQSLLTAGKEYVCLMTVHDDKDPEKIKQAMMRFVGEIDQLPPVRSAVKRQLRKRTIYYIDIIEIKGRFVLFKVGCQAGTYIRKLCNDIGLQLGSGAHMAELRRTMAASFDESTLCTLQDLTDAYYYYKEKQDEAPLRRILQPLEEGVKHLPKAWVLDSTVHTLCHGAFLNIPGIAKLHDRIEKGDRVAVMTLNEELVCVGIAQLSSDDVMKKDKGLFLKPEQVFMFPDLYPKSP